MLLASRRFLHCRAGCTEMRNAIADQGRQYETVARAIAFIRSHARRQPALKEIADSLGLSEFHLQKVFSQWAGVSPKRFLQYVTKEYAKQALLSVAPGEVVSYSQLAQMAGVPKAQRAVGSAIGKNNIPLLIPCHRVIRETGEISNYRWGVERKVALLAREAARAARSNGAIETD